MVSNGYLFSEEVVEKALNDWKLEKATEAAENLKNLEKRFAELNLDMPDNNTMANMYNAISDYLSLPRYEVSNYAMPNNQNPI